MATNPDMAIQVSGYQGKELHAVNGVYEPLGYAHNGRAAWVSRAVAPVYLFHSGKTRWVITKSLDDAGRCYAFVNDDGTDNPTTCRGPWQSCDQSGQWRADGNIRTVPVSASTDMFVKLRQTVEAELRDFGLFDNNKLKQVWRSLDKNGNKVVSLAEIDSLVVDMTKAGTWPSWINCKPALQRAYQKTTKLDGNDDDWVEKEEFHALLLNIFWFAHLHQIYDQIDTNDDAKISQAEFIAGMNALGLTMTHDDAAQEFNRIDADHHGAVLFVEFCCYVRGRINPDHDPHFDKDMVSGETSGTTVRKEHGDKATSSHCVVKKNLGQFDALEKKIKDTCKDDAKIKKLWKSLDFNGNNVVSLAEIDKFVIENYEILNHKPALMRAYKRTIQVKNERDEFVHKKDFKCLLANLFYFNKLFWLFDQVDEDRDRRMTVAEFKWCLSVAGVKTSDAKAQSEFKKIDKNGGGIILFDEFCLYFVQKECPAAMSEYIEK